MKKINFGVGIPTGTEGLMYPIPFAKAEDNLRIATIAEKLGFDSVWGNDHIATQKYVREEFKSSPNYYAPLLILTAIAENTKNLKLATGLLVVPFRHPAIIAKELATLDHISSGRAIAGVGIGAYREEFECIMGEKAKDMVRGEMLEESLTIIKKIFEEDIVTYNGKYFDIRSLQSSPKPVQKPFPFYIGGNSAAGYKRVAKFGTGWFPAVLTPEEIKAGVSNIEKHCEEMGRNIEDIDIAPQLSISIGKTHEEAESKFRTSQMYKHLESLKNSTLKNQDTGEYSKRNLIGTPDEIGERIQQYIEAGVTNFAALLFATNTVDELIESMQFFAEEVMSKF